MCEGFEWMEWQGKVERAQRQKADELKKQARTAAPPESAEPKEQEEPVPV